MTIETENPGATATPPATETAAVADATSTPATDAGAGQGQGEAEPPKDGEAQPGTTGEAEAAEGKDDEPQGAPEQYAAFELPEGYALEGERLEAAQEFAKANNWTQAQAQAGINQYLQMREAERVVERGLWAQMSVEEFGDGFQPLVDGVTRIKPELERVRPGIVDRLDATNLGNHPDVLWLIAKYGELTSEQPMRGANNESASGKDLPLGHPNRLYRNMT